MKIKYALVSSNSNPDYYEFWPIVSKLWKEYIGIEPILLFIGNEIPKELDEKYGKILLFKPIPGIPEATQSQFIRLWYTQFLDDIVITSDIDMLPLSKPYFNHQIRHVGDDKFIILGFNQEGYNICYNVAKPETFKELLNLKEDFGENLNPIYRETKSRGEEWFTDEIYLRENLSKYKGDKIVRFDRGKSPWLSRIDRARWDFNPGMLKIGAYIDCHSVRPYSKFKKEIDNLINSI